MSFSNTIKVSELSTNQKILIRAILNDETEFYSPAFIDIKPCFNKMFDLKITAGSNVQLLKHYTHIFQSLSQVVCKGLAKEWVKVICPRKQAAYPYKQPIKPDWWPNNVRHLEPDHLDKDSRIALLMSIIRNKDIDLVALKRSITKGAFGSNFSSENVPVVQGLVYELFYVSLYERLFSGESVNSDLINELPTSEIDAILSHRVIYIKVSYLEGDFALVKRAEEQHLNKHVFTVANYEEVPYSMYQLPPKPKRVQRVKVFKPEVCLRKSPRVRVLQRFDFEEIEEATDEITRSTTPADTSISEDEQKLEIQTPAEPRINHSQKAKLSKMAHKSNDCAERVHKSTKVIIKFTTRVQEGKIPVKIERIFNSEQDTTTENTENTDSFEPQSSSPSSSPESPSSPSPLSSSSFEDKSQSNPQLPQNTEKLLIPSTQDTKQNSPIEKEIKKKVLEFPSTDLVQLIDQDSYPEQPELQFDVLEQNLYDQLDGHLDDTDSGSSSLDLVHLSNYGTPSSVSDYNDKEFDKEFDF